MTTTHSEAPKRIQRKSEHFGQVEGLTLKKFILVRKVYLQELLAVEVLPCALCGLNREILWFGNYDRDTSVEVFNVCELCAKELIENSGQIISEVRNSK